MLRAEEFLRPFIRQFAYAIVMFDREGCGRTEKTRDELERLTTDALSRSGWADRATVIVIDPELENWVFSGSPEVDVALGWHRKDLNLRAWLESHHYLVPGEIKPGRPKEAMEAALRHVRQPRSSSIYGRLAQHVGIERCTDGAFRKLKATLQTWFPYQTE